MIRKPMLACRVGRPEDVRFPVMASPKIDGIRCLIVDGQALTRKFKPIPNRYIREWLERYCPNGVDLDGEIVLRGASFQGTTSAVMSEDGAPDFFYHVFDCSRPSLEVAYSERYATLLALFDWASSPVKEHMMPLVHISIANQGELDAYEKDCMDAHYEGVMVRSPDGPYKNGRSTVKEGFMLKIKRFDDGEAAVVGFVPLRHNANPAEKDAFGRTKRSHAAEGMVDMDTLGALQVKDLVTGVEFEVGTGFTQAQRDAIWEDRDAHLGKVVKYKHQPSGSKDKPRFPVFLGFRDERDMEG